MNYRTISTRCLTLAISALLLLVALTWLYGPGWADATSQAAIELTVRVSVAGDGAQADTDTNEAPALSADGRYVAFDSLATNLVPGDTNDEYDIFVHDRQTGATERLSLTSDGVQRRGISWAPVISDDGRFVAFASNAELVGGLYSDGWHVYVRDRQTGQTTRATVASDGTVGNGASINRPAISADGRFVAYASESSNLIAADTNNAVDAFVHDRYTGQTTRVSVASDGAEANGWSESPALSADGRYVVFASDASNLVTGDNNNRRDIFLHDRQTGATTLLSVRLAGASWSEDAHIPDISADGRWVAFTSPANDLVPGDSDDGDDIFLVDTSTGALSLVSVNSNGEKGNGDSDRLALSADGRLIAFYSQASNLVPDDTNDRGDIFVHDRESGRTWRASLGNSGEQGNGGSFTVGISADGHAVGFASFASNFVPGDTNEVSDIFVRYSLGGEISAYLPVVQGGVTVGRLRVSQD